MKSSAHTLANPGNPSRILVPRANMSKELLRIRSTLMVPSPSTPKRLYFTSAHLLENRRGERFGLSMKRAPYFYKKAYVLKEGAGEEPGAFMKFGLFKSENCVEITDLHSFPSLREFSLNYSIPKRKLRGYGFLQVAIFLATSMAKKYEVENIRIEPSSFKVADYYESWGFAPQGIRRRMLFPLKETPGNESQPDESSIYRLLKFLGIRTRFVWP